MQPARSILKAPKVDGVAPFASGGSLRRSISWQDIHGQGELTVVHYFEPRYAIHQRPACARDLTTSVIAANRPTRTTKK